MPTPDTHCGYAAIIGRPNVGKSTLLNKILGQKISITSFKPQTTRFRILGIKTTEHTQVVFVDTPGLHQDVPRALNRYMNRAAMNAIHDVDVVLFVLEALLWTEDDDWILQRIAKVAKPVIAVVNKVDDIADKEQLLPYLKTLSEKFSFFQIIPVSARRGTYLEQLEAAITRCLPEGPFLFPKDQVTDRSERFLAAEIVREKLLYLTGQEVPHALSLEIEEFKQKDKILHISAVIWVEREGQKAIIVGKNGAKLKEVGTQARLELEKIFAKKIFLRLWVKVKENWSDDERSLRSLGYD